MNVIKLSENVLLSLGTLLIALVMLYGVSSLIVRFSPQPLSGWFSQIVQHSTPAGWSMSSPQSNTGQM